MSEGRWRSLLCENRDCCPAEGRMLPSEPSVFIAEATFAGLTALPNRAALAALLDPAPTSTAISEEIRRQLDTALSVTDGDVHQAYVRSVIDALTEAHRAAEGGRPPADLDAGRYAVALQSTAVRDAVWTAADDGELEGETLWLDLARRLPSPYDAPAMFLVAWRAWRVGNGALAGIAAVRAIASDPGYRAADLLLAALDRGADPRRLPTLRLPKDGDAPTAT